MTGVVTAHPTLLSRMKNWYNRGTFKEDLAFLGRPDPTGQLYAFKAGNCAADILRGLDVHSSLARGFIRLSTELEPASQIIGILTAPFMFEQAVTSFKRAVEARKEKKFIWSYEGYVRFRPMIIDAHVFENLSKVVDRNPTVREFKQLQTITTKAKVQNSGEWSLRVQDIKSFTLEAISRMSMYVGDIAIAIHRFVPFEALHFSPSFVQMVLKITRISALLAGCVTFGSSFYRLMIATSLSKAKNLNESEKVYYQETIKQERAILSKTFLKVALLVWTTAFSLVFQGIVNLSVMVIDIYLAKQNIQLPTYVKAEDANHVCPVYYQISATDAVKNANLQRLSYERLRV